jgi:hypothetical protein
MRGSGGRRGPVMNLGPFIVLVKHGAPSPAGVDPAIYQHAPNQAVFSLPPQVQQQLQNPTGISEHLQQQHQYQHQQAYPYPSQYPNSGPNGNTSYSSTPGPSYGYT